MTDTTPDLTGARMFKERDRDSAMRWYLLLDNTVLVCRAPETFERSIHTAADLVGSEALIEVTQ
jgi:hypothetical protein